MTVPSTGPVTAALLDAEMGRAAGSAVSFNDPGLRLLTRNTAKLSAASAINADDVRGGTGYPMPGYMSDWNYGDGTKVGAKGYYGMAGDGINSVPLGWIAPSAGTPLFEIVSEPGVTALRFHHNVTGAIPDFSIFFWGLQVYTAAMAPLFSARYSQTTYRTDVADVFGGRNAAIGWNSTDAGYFDLRPYKGQWLNFLFTK